MKAVVLVAVAAAVVDYQILEQEWLFCCLDAQYLPGEREDERYFQNFQIVRVVSVWILLIGLIPDRGHPGDQSRLRQSSRDLEKEIGTGYFGVLHQKVQVGEQPLFTKENKKKKKTIC